jgi:ATP-dependent exoDNAse (exonuclease V) beta subunit
MILFNEESHTYTDTTTNEEYISVTTLLGRFKPIFDAESAARRVARREGIPYEIVLETWNTQKQIACDRGTPIHKAMEDFICNKIINKNYNKSLYSSFRDIIKEYKFKDIISEKLLYSYNYKVAGTTDLIINHDEKYFSILDFKTNKRIRTTTQYNEFLLKPVDHLTCCEYIIYTLQLSMYAYMYESMLNKTCKGIGILYLDNDSWVKIPSVYLKKDVINILNYYKEHNF